MTDWSELPWWKRLLLLPLAVLVFPISFGVVLAIVLPVAVWNSVFWCCYWVRFKVTGVPIPPKGFVEPDRSEG